MNTKLFSALIALALLIIYVFSISTIILKVISCAEAEGCDSSSFDISTGHVYILTTIGGLVSALVIARLAIAKPPSVPSIVSIIEDENNKFQIILSWIYLIVWLVAGLTSLIVGVVLYPDISSTLSDIGTTWIGLAVASAYSYFGIDPD